MTKRLIGHHLRPCNFIVLLLLSSLLAPFASGQSATAAVDFSSLEQVMQAELQATKTPGAAVAIVRGDRVLFAKGFGVANIETGAPVAPDMLFRLGSTTKMFTGAALVVLAAQGKLKLDEPIGKHVAGLHPNLARITAHQLISNSAGMADFEAPFISHDDEALGRMVRGWKEDAQFTEPGQVYSYASPGFWLAGHVIEAVTKKPYADAMDELVFQPLGMSRTTLRPLVALTYPLAMGHSASPNEGAKIIRPAYNNVAQWPAGSIYSSVNDLSRFVRALLNSGQLDGKQLLAPDVAAKLPGEYIQMPGDPNVHYGYGLLVFEERGQRMVMHGGFSRGYGSMIQMIPAQRLAVIVTTNKSGETLARTRAKALELLLPLKPEAADKSKTAQPLDAAEMANYVGRYVNGPQTWEVIGKDGKLYFKQPEGGDAELKKTGPNRLSFGPTLENELVFVPGARGEMEYIFDGLYSGKKKR